MVLFQLLGTIVEEGRRFAATADMKVSDMSAQAPVGTTLALLERQLKVMSAVQARMHYSMKQELRLLAAIIRDYTEDDYEYDPTGEVNRHAKKTDYEHVDIIPVSDPNAATMSQRVVQYQAVIQLAQMAPDIYDLPQLHRQMLGVLGIKNADKILPLPDDAKPKDPVSENMAVLKGEPVKAFQNQNHEAHIQVHMAATQDPRITQLIAQNPRAQIIQGAMMAHIAEHVGFAYRQRIEQQLGMALPGEDDMLDPQMEHQLAQMMAQAGQQVLQQSMQQQAQEKAAQDAQDPVVQMQQQELAQKDKELMLKYTKTMGDLAAKKDELAQEDKELMLKYTKTIGDLAAKKDELELREQDLLSRTAHNSATLAADNQHKGMAAGVDIAKHRAQLTNNKQTPGSKK
jgi:hypothetical protein